MKGIWTMRKIYLDGKELEMVGTGEYKDWFKDEDGKWRHLVIDEEPSVKIEPPQDSDMDCRVCKEHACFSMDLEGKVFRNCEKLDMSEGT